jgi:hypothetical protein
MPFFCGGEIRVSSHGPESEGNKDYYAVLISAMGRSAPHT